MKILKLLTVLILLAVGGMTTYGQTKIKASEMAKKTVERISETVALDKKQSEAIRKIAQSYYTKMDRLTLLKAKTERDTQMRTLSKAFRNSVDSVLTPAQLEAITAKQTVVKDTIRDKNKNKLTHLSTKK